MAHLLARSDGFSYGTMQMAQRPFFRDGVCFARLRLACILFIGLGRLNSVPAAESSHRTFHELLNPQGSVELLRKGSNAWVPARTNLALFPGDAVRTGKESRAAVRLSNESVIRLDQLTVIRFPEPTSPRKRFLVNLLKGAVYFFHRERPVETDFETPLVSGAIRGTEFNLAVADNGRTVLTLLDGAVELSNAQGQLALRGGEQAVVDPGGAPVKTAVIDAVNVIQWCLYYPAVIDSDELGLGDAERQALSASLAAYRNGDLLQALAKYPANRQPVVAPEKIYRAQLDTAVGQIAEAEQLLNSIPEGDSRDSQLAGALRTLIAAVKLQAGHRLANPQLASPLLAQSYEAQSRVDLAEALRLARAAVGFSPSFGFAWTRVAELEFSFGRTAEALAAINEALRLSPRSAQALAVKGFLLAAQNRFSDAFTHFEQAIAVDSALGNGWLGRGLSRIRQGHSEAGRDDLLVAAALEPNRALLRSYLGKAFSEVGDNAKAAKELELAKRLDPNDPTGWLYSALLNQQRNRINQAVDDLEHSVDLNNNRQLYRSRLLLDEDRAVRGANLATIYLDAGMPQRSFQEAARSANADYANYSSHLFLANSYNELRDPKQINLRYETPWLSEYLLANLLAPVQAGALSQTVSQQEYSRLFERNRLGFVSSTEYQSQGDWAQAAAQYGIYDNMAYAADVFYRSQNGWRPNNDLDQLTVSLELKEQVTPSDSAYFQAIYYRANAGDLRQLYDQNNAILGLRTKETQEPLLIGGWHHEWSRESHTLFLAGRLQDTFTYTNPVQQVLSLTRDPNGEITRADPGSLPLGYRNDLEIYTAEVQQIWQHNQFKVIGGGRYQFGEFETRNQIQGTFFLPPTDTSAETDFERASVYGYGHWQALDSLLLIGGVTYDWLKFPENFRAPPISGNESRTDRVSPKAGVIWTPWRDTALRAAYTRSLGGVSFDQSFQLEPSQIAGFSQVFRSLIPESVAGSLSAQRFETYGVALDQKFATRTYAGISAELLRSDAVQDVGTFDVVFPSLNPVVSTTRERFRFKEKSLNINLNQLVAAEWSLGAHYRLTRADLEDEFSDVPVTAATSGNFVQHPAATLHQLHLFAAYNHPSGFFSQVQSLWSAQSNSGYSPAEPGDDFWQFNAFVGYRFPRRRAELTLGVLNINDRDYRLNPLTLYSELPRKRTAVVSLKFNF